MLIVSRIDSSGSVVECTHTRAYFELLLPSLLRREPLLKVMQILRSLLFQRRPNIQFRHGLMERMSYKIGQYVFDPPDQFSFFSSTYAPPGVFAETGMVSPEAELLSMSSVVGIVS